MTKRFALIGDPVSHSLSPPMHAAAFEALGLDATYEARRVPPSELGDAVAGLWSAGFHGFNVTVPHKLGVMEHLSFVDECASAIGAVNTVTRHHDGWHGTNTDAEGFVRSLPGPAYESALVLGAGGAARAVVYGLCQQGVDVKISARRAAAADALAPLGATTCSWPPPMTDPLVVNATSASFHAGGAFADSLRWGEHDGALFVDLAYGAPFPFLERAKGLGANVLDGMGMLVHQGAIAFELWTGEMAPVEEMQAALRSRFEPSEP